MGVARSAPQGAHYHTDVIYLFPKLGIKNGTWDLWYSGKGLHLLGSRPTLIMPQLDNKPSHSIPDVIVLSELAELNKVQRPTLWPYDYYFKRMSR